MTRTLTKDMVAPAIPKSVIITASAREPTTDPRLGIPLALALPAVPAKHRLVTIGDSLTHGFQSAAIYNTDISFPRIIAWEMGWDSSFRYPRYPGFGGLPLNIEYVVRKLERVFGNALDWWELAAAAFRLRSITDEIEDYWERGSGSHVPAVSGIHHNLGVYGWDLRDVLSRTSRVITDALAKPKDNWLLQLVENHNDRAALRVLPPLAADGPGVGVLDAAEALGNDGEIETLIVLLGANNALGTVVQLKVKWSGPGYDDLAKKGAFTVWDPDHFDAELQRLVARIRSIKARHVIWGTVPHVTIAPLARGVANKVAPESRYFPYYTRPWIRDDEFQPNDDPHITENEARAIDSAIDQYNDAIVDAVRVARSDPNDPRDWYVLDVAGLLDRVAQRRYIDSIPARPPWWTQYELPAVLAELRPPPNSHFFASGPNGRTDGGLFTLDGVHPTTVCYGILAQEFISVMQLAGVKFLFGDGKTERAGTVNVDFKRLLVMDTLLSDPPRSFTSDLRLLGWLDEKVDVLTRMLRTVV